MQEPYIVLGIEADPEKARTELVQKWQHQLRSRLKEDEESGLTIPTFFS